MVPGEQREVWYAVFELHKLGKDAQGQHVSVFELVQVGYEFVVQMGRRANAYRQHEADSGNNATMSL